MKKQVIDKNTYEKYKSIENEKNALLKKVNTVLACLIAISLIPSIVLVQLDPPIAYGFIAFGVLLGVLLIANIVIGIKYAKITNSIEAYETAQEEERKRIEENLRQQQQATAQDAMLRLDDIKKTIIVETHTGKDNDNAMTRGVVGALLFGATGAIVGTATAQEKSYTTFLIIYNDDSRTTQTVENGSTLYNHYIKFLDV